MKIIIFILVLITISNGAPRNGYDDLEIAKPCKPELCKLPKCLCSSITPPNNVNRSEIPQLVLLTFDDAVNVQNFGFYEEALFNRSNPDGCPVGATFFISHEYTNYTMVHDLWTRGFEIALHSITHQPPTEYWRDISVEELHRQFTDQLIQFETFAQISKSDIQGIRIPFLQLSGNRSFEMLQEAGLKYDCTWPTQAYMNVGLWPYTLDYKSIQDCSVGNCPTASFPGIWEVPMIDWSDNSGNVCAMVDSCIDVPSDEEGIFQFMIRNFNRHYTVKNKSPFGFFVHASWFVTPHRFSAYQRFLNYLQEHKDVYLVSVQRALQWMENPTTISNLTNVWPKCQPLHENQCVVNIDCQYQLEGGNSRTFSKCGADCPTNYPGLENPLGD